MRLKLGLLATAAMIALAATVAVPVAGAQTAAPAAGQAVSQQLVGTTGNLVYDLTATVTQITGSVGALQAVGTLTGTVTNTVTGAVTAIDQAFTTPVTSLASIANGTLVSVSLGGVDVGVLGQTLSLSPIQVSADSNGLLGGLLGQLTGLLGGLVGSL